MSQSLLLVGLPYAAMVVFVAGLLWRLRAPVTISSLSSQVLESRWLVWGTVPFHAGVAILFVGHLAPLVAPGAWARLVSNRTALLVVESIGSAAAMLVLIGLVVLLARRILSDKVRAVATAADYLVLVILAAQAGTGLTVATLHRWGAVWSVGTTTPYLRSLLMLDPNPAFVAGVPPLMTWHLAGAWIIIALIPFTRLVHLLFAPLGYLSRPPLKVVWASRKVRRSQASARL